MEVRVFGGIPGVIGKLVCYDYERILPFIGQPSELIAPEVFCFCSWVAYPSTSRLLILSVV